MCFKGTCLGQHYRAPAQVENGSFVQINCRYGLLQNSEEDEIIIPITHEYQTNILSHVKKISLCFFSRFSPEGPSLPRVLPSSPVMVQ
jgi:hypothetical protein